MDRQSAVGPEAKSLCSSLYARRPDWITGAVSHYDALFLFEHVCAASTDVVVEIGTASGLSTAVICAALEHSSSGQDAFRLFTYDISPRFYADPARRTGDAARELLSPGQVEHIEFRNPATATNLRSDHAADSIEFFFLDADHRHPWPTLDVLAALDTLAPGAEIVLHDVNLPNLKVEHPQWGAKHLFDGLDVEKQLDSGGEVPNIGSCRVPANKEIFRNQLLEILYGHEWEDDVGAGAITAALALPSGPRPISSPAT